MYSFKTRVYVSFFWLMGLFLGCRSGDGQKKIILNDTIDLGAVTVGDKRNFVIDLFNPTDQFLTIVNVKGSCECVEINNCPPGLQSQKNGMINATYDSKYERKKTGVLYKSVVIQVDKKPFLHAVKLKVTIE